MRRRKHIRSISDRTGSREYPAASRQRWDKHFPCLCPRSMPMATSAMACRLPEIVVPLATYAAWNLRDPSIGAPDRAGSVRGGLSSIPQEPGERQKSGDPRKSIAERYPNREDYLARYTAAVDDLVQQRWILPEDRAALIHRGEQEWIETTK